MKSKLLLLGLVVVSGLASAKMYKWVDENGVTHYSKSKPDNVTTSEVKVKGMPENEEGENSQSNSSTRGLNCDQAVRNGLKLLAQQIKKSGGDKSGLSSLVNDPGFIREGIDECNTDKSNPVKAAEWLCKQTARNLNAVKACEK